MQNRRKFLSLLGVSTAAGPLAARAAADAQSAVLMRVTATGLDAGYGIAGGQPTDMPYEQKVIGAADYVKVFGVPKVIEDTYRLNSKYVGALDPDIACKKSWSLSVKIMTQRERNYNRSIEHLQTNGIRQRGVNALKTLMGFDWPW
jgi:hypothetical protein